MYLRCFGLLAILPFIIYKSSAQQVVSKTGNELSLLDSVYDKIMRLYVEKNEPAKLIRTGIEATLSSLDPFSSYLTADEAKEFHMMISGKLGGTGLVIRSVDGQIMVSQIFKGYPADKAGILAGDIILEADGITLEGKSIFDVFPILRGTPGSTVKLLIQRPGGKTTEMKTLQREEITISSVPYYGILEGGIGYILLTSETEHCSDDVRMALMDMKSRRELKGLILDLRYNTGGLLKEAVKIVNLFIDKGKPVISEKGRSSDTTYYSSEEAVDTKTPLAILVNGSTISSAEIITGALQDHDRAVVIGNKTFGKGMVQQLYDLPTGEILRITVSYYYTPSGRCIQKKTYSVKKEGIIIPDSLKIIFRTSNGRKVIDHDGISPDFELPEQPLAAITNELIGNELSNNFVFRFATEYCSGHRTIAPAASFTLSDAEYRRFIDFLKDKNFSYTTHSETKISELKSAALQEGYWDGIQPVFAAMQSQMKKEKEKDLIRFKDQIKELLEEEIVLHRYYQWGRIENSLKNDSGVKKAKEVFTDRSSYAHTLGK
jgi:carboxyl-terminal processing protease